LVSKNPRQQSKLPLPLPLPLLLLLQSCDSGMAPPNRKLFSSIHATLYDALNRSSTRALTRAGPWVPT
jgi:hypothetical protein